MNDASVGEVREMDNVIFFKNFLKIPLSEKKRILGQSRRKYEALPMMMTVMILMVTMVAALRKSCGLIQHIVGGLLTQMENDDGRWY